MSTFFGPPAFQATLQTAAEHVLPDQIADAWAAVLIDIYQRLKQREEKPKDGDGK